MDITRVLRGQRIAAVLKNGYVLQIRTHEGTEINITWADDNGNPIKGTPTVARVGYRLQAEDIHQLIRLPGEIEVKGLAR